MRFSYFLLLTFHVLFICGTSGAQVLHKLISPNEEENGDFGMAVSGIGDVNNDGHRDLIVGAPGEVDDVGRVYLFNGAAGELLYTVISPVGEAGGQFGCSVSDLGDVNDDGANDFVVGALHQDPGTSPDGAGRAYVFSGATGDTLYSLVSLNEDTNGEFGVSVSGVSDVDGDGRHDVIVGAGYEDPAGSPVNAGRAYVFNGSTGALLYTLTSPNETGGGSFGHSVSGLEDVDNDLYGDLIVGAWGDTPGGAPGSAGRVYVFSGASAEILYTLSSPNEQAGGNFGARVSGAGDVDADGIMDIIVGAPGESPNAQSQHHGRSYVFSGASGELLLTLTPSIWLSYGNFGASVAGAGDIDYDGHDDLVVGIYGTGHGRAFLFSGATGYELYMFRSPSPDGYGSFGYSLAGAGDLNNDELGDVIIGAYRESSNYSPDRAGRAYVFSGILIPVELSMFAAEAGEEGVLLRWRTESEEDCFGFHVYRQQEGSPQRQRITEHIISGGGTSAVPRDYSYLDPIAEPGSYSYWLEEVADDGKTTEFGPVEVTVFPTSLVLEGPYPNPVRDKAELRLMLPSDLDGTAELRLFDVNGRQIGKPIKQEVGSDHLVRWSAVEAGCAPGVYQWRVSAGREIVSVPMVVVK